MLYVIEWLILTEKAHAIQSHVSAIKVINNQELHR